MEEHPLEVLGVVAVDDGMSCVVGVPNDHIEAPACPLTLVECTFQKIESAEAIPRASELLPLELGNFGLRQDTREFARCRRQLVRGKRDRADAPVTSVSDVALV